MDDDVMPNDGSYFSFREPVEQVVERKKERAKTLEYINTLQEIIDRLNERISFYESVKSIPDEVKLNPEELIRVLNANALTAENLTNEKVHLESLISTYKR